MANEIIPSIILAIIQGITEWLPVSSSGHLVLVENLIGFSGGLMFEVALHFGTLMAVFVYFGREITDILRDFFIGKWKTQNGKIGVLLVISSIPAAIVGFLAADFFDTLLSDLRIVALGFGITGLLMFISSIEYNKNKKLNFKSAIFMGFAQALAIIPGVSRSGSTISAGLFLGLNEKSAMKFAFLMSIPIVFGASILSIGNKTLPPELIWATLVSFIVGLLTIHLMYTKLLVSRKNFKYFGVYCLILALIVGIIGFS